MTFFRRLSASLAALSASLLVAAPVQAQFGGLIPSIPRSGSSNSDDGCPKGRSRSGGSSVLGGVLGGIAGQAASRAGISSWVPIGEVTDTLSNAIACRLDPEEQKQAAAATRDAIGDEGAPPPQVGSSSNWVSATRADVTGTSTVVASTQEPVPAPPRNRRNRDTANAAPATAGEAPAQMSCITVTDVIIVNGEETTANKRMCRPPGSARYSLMA